MESGGFGEKHRGGCLWLNMKDFFLSLFDLKEVFICRDPVYNVHFSQQPQSVSQSELYWTQNLCNYMAIKHQSML